MKEVLYAVPERVEDELVMEECEHTITKCEAGMKFVGEIWRFPGVSVKRACVSVKKVAWDFELEGLSNSLRIGEKQFWQGGRVLLISI